MRAKDKLSKVFSKFVGQIKEAKQVHKDPVSYGLLALGITAWVVDSLDPLPIGEIILGVCLTAVIKRGYDLRNKCGTSLKETFWIEFETASSHSEKKSAVLKYAVNYLKLGRLMPRKLGRTIKNPSIEILPNNAIEMEMADFISKMVTDSSGFVKTELARMESGVCSVMDTISSKSGYEKITYRLSYNR